MKTLIVLLVTIISFYNLCYGEVEYAYKKINNKVEITTTEATIKVNSFEATIETLLEEKATLINRKAQAITNHKSNLSNFDEQIALIDAHIQEARDLGVIEIID